MADEELVAAMRPRRAGPWFLSAFATGLFGLATGFAGLMIGSDEALAARPWLVTSGTAIVLAVVMLFVGVARAIQSR